MTTQMENIINWKQISRILAGNETSIRKYKCPKKYQKKVSILLQLVELWEKVYVIEQSSDMVIQDKEFMNLLIRK